LRVDLYDPHAKLSLGGAIYHVGHPGGRNYETFPVNANEAQARRAARFSAYSGSPGNFAAVRPEVNAEFPHTLDLRFVGAHV
jgi:uncharacterized protein (DUF2126 family)